MTEQTITLVLIDDHELIRAGVRAELTGPDAATDPSIDVVGEAGSVEDAVDGHPANSPRRRSPRCPPAGRRRTGRHRGHRRRQAAVPVPRPLCFRRSRRRDRGRSCGCPGLRHQVDLGRRPSRCDRPRPRRRRRVLAAPGRLRARRLRRRRGGEGPRRRKRSRPRSPDDPGARGDATDRPRLRLQGDRQQAVPVGEDGGDPRVGRAAQAPVVQPTPTDRLGQRA